MHCLCGWMSRNVVVMSCADHNPHMYEIERSIAGEVGKNVLRRKTVVERTWWAWPVEAPRAALYIVHGLGEHAGRYAKTAARLNEHRIGVWSQDLPGFGRTVGRRGDVRRFDVLYDTITHGMEKMIEAAPHVPYYLFGHSLGGLLALAWVMKGQDGARAPLIRKLRGLILSSPALSLKHAPPLWQDRSARLLSWIWPTFTLSTGISANVLSHDPEVVKSYDADPYVHRWMSLRFYRQFQETMAWVRLHPAALPYQLPLWMMQAGDDQLVEPQALQTFYETQKRIRAAKGVDAAELELVVWEGWYHELLNEPEGDQALAAMVDFIFRHSKDIRDEGETDGSAHE